MIRPHERDSRCALGVAAGAARTDSGAPLVSFPPMVTVTRSVYSSRTSSWPPLTSVIVVAPAQAVKSSRAMIFIHPSSFTAYAAPNCPHAE
jgi:hypothetical protein